MRIGILGAGLIGRALAGMLDKTPGIRAVTLADVAGGVGAERLDAADPGALAAFAAGHDAVASALPFRLNKAVAQACRNANRAYFDFTEDTDTARFVQDLAQGACTTFMPHCGLAPGTVNIVAADLIEGFEGRVRSAILRVGALPRTASNAMRYALTWSAAGVVNEYIRPCDALHAGRRMQAIPLDGLETLMLDGVEYEAFNTSGGLATMCDTYAGRVGTLNYKTMRYPGHCAHMRFLLHDLDLWENPEIVESLFEQAVPTVEDDLVVLYAAATGLVDGRPVQRSYLRTIRPAPVSLSTMGDGTACLTAIQVSTAAGMAGVLQLWANGLLPNGFVRQESVKLSLFLGTLWGGKVYG